MVARRFCIDPPRAGPARRAWTLAELVVSSACIAILATGMASAIVLSTRALPENGAHWASTTSANDALDRLTAELLCAVSVTARSATTLEFAIPDRDNDGVPETLRYVWSGVAGQPLTRQYNGSTAVPVVDRVGELAFAYDVVSTSQTTDPNETTSGEVLLFEYLDFNYLGSRSVSSSRWPGQYFRPNLPPNAIRWRVTNFSIILAFDGIPTGQFSVQLRRATVDGKPTADVLSRTTVNESSLPPGYEYRTYTTAANVPAVSPAEGLCIVLEHLSNSPSGRTMYQYAGVSRPDMLYVESADNGASWTTASDKALLFNVYGTVTTLRAGEVQVIQQLDAVRIRLRADTADGPLIETAVQLLNNPVVSG